MIKCDKYCEPLCDFCIYGTAFIAREKSIRGFHGNIWCNLDHIMKEPWEKCNHFHCFRATNIAPEFSDKIVPNKWCPNHKDIDINLLTQEAVEAMPDNASIADKERVKC